MAALGITTVKQKVALNTRIAPASAQILIAKLVRLDASGTQYSTAECDSDAAAATPVGMAPAEIEAANDSGVLLGPGSVIDTGLALTQGTMYFLGPAGGFVPFADLSTSGWFITVAAVAINTSDIRLILDATGATIP